MIEVFLSTVSSDISIQLVIIIVLTAINAFLAASELAILSANPNKLHIMVEEGNKKAKLVLKLQEDETKLLSTIQVGITFAGFFSSATAAVSLSEGMASFLSSAGVPFADEGSLILVTLILSYFTLVLGELFPKRIALRSPEKIAVFVSKPINITKKIFRPIVFILSASCTLLSKLFRIDNEKNDKVTEKEVIALVNEAVDDGSINEDEQELIENVITFGDLVVKDVMIPRVDVFMINIDSTPSNIKHLLKQEKFTRVPVYEENKDNILGIINIKDVFFGLKSSFTIEEFRSMLRKPYFVVESMSAGLLLKKLNEMHEHCAVVIDKVGGVSGYITMEDLLEEITGKIYDEHDVVVKMIEKIDDNNYLINPSISILDFNRELDLNISKSIDYNSFSGFIQKKLGHMPVVNDEYICEAEHFSFKVIKAKKNKIISVQVTKF